MSKERDRNGFIKHFGCPALWWWSNSIGQSSMKLWHASVNNLYKLHAAHTKVCCEKKNWDTGMSYSKKGRGVIDATWLTSVQNVVWDHRSLSLRWSLDACTTCSLWHRHSHFTLSHILHTSLLCCDPRIIKEKRQHSQSTGNISISSTGLELACKRG